MSRTSGAQIGRYTSRVSETDVPYLFPTDNGTKTDVRWAAITDDAGLGLLISAAQDEVVHVR